MKEQYVNDSPEFPMEFGEHTSQNTNLRALLTHRSN